MKIKDILKGLVKWLERDWSKALLIFIFNLPFVSFSLYYGIRCSGCWADMILKIILFIVYLSLARWSLKTASLLEAKSEWNDIDVLYDKCCGAWAAGVAFIFVFFTLPIYFFGFIDCLTDQLNWQENIGCVGNLSIISLIVPCLFVLIESLSHNKKY